MRGSRKTNKYIVLRKYYGELYIYMKKKKMNDEAIEKNKNSNLIEI